MGLDNPIHILFLLVLALLVFGAKRLPEMGRSLGEGMRGFKDSLNPQDTPMQVSAVTAAAPAPVAAPMASADPFSAPVPVSAPAHAEPVHQV